MSERWLENLVRMAGEAERLDRCALPAAVPARALGGRGGGERRWTRSLTFLAAAALVLCVILPHAWLTERKPRPVRAASGVNICHLADETRVERVAVDPVVRGSADSAWLLALVRSWNVDCQCLLWELHRFADGGALADVRPGDSLSLDLNVAQSPAVEQVLVLAVADDRSRLAGATSADAVELLNCLNSRDIAATGEHDTAGYASAVQSCLPQGVTVVSRPLLQSEN
jgi:hypothetical protein